jgi:hypothetical protein
MEQAVLSAIAAPTGMAIAASVARMDKFGIQL